MCFESRFLEGILYAYLQLIYCGLWCLFYCKDFFAVFFFFDICKSTFYDLCLTFSYFDCTITLTGASIIPAFFLTKSLQIFQKSFA